MITILGFDAVEAFLVAFRELHRRAEALAEFAPHAAQALVVERTGEDQQTLRVRDVRLEDLDRGRLARSRHGEIVSAHAAARPQ